MVNIADLDEMPHVMALHQGLHCLLRERLFLEIITCDPSINMDHFGSNV